MLLRVEPDGTMTLPIGSGEAVRRDATLRQALNTVRPVLVPEDDCRVFEYKAAARPVRADHSGHAGGNVASAT